MRSVTTFLLESSWERDFSCLSMSSSTFSRQEGAMSLVEDWHVCCTALFYPADGINSRLIC